MGKSAGSQGMVDWWPWSWDYGSGGWSIYKDPACAVGVSGGQRVAR